MLQIPSTSNNKAQEWILLIFSIIKTHDSNISTFFLFSKIEKYGNTMQILDYPATSSLQSCDSSCFVNYRFTNIFLSVLINCG